MGVQVSRRQQIASVAVISTYYNQNHLIDDAIRSVREQDTDASLHHVICDDGSDEPLERNGVKVVRVTNRGFPGALNAALLNVPADTDFVVVLPGDDFLAPHYVQRCLSAVGKADVVITSMRKVGYPDVHPDLQFFTTITHPTVRQLWEWKQTYVWSVAMIRYSTLVETGGFHPATSGDCDWDMWIDLRSRGARFSYAPDTWYFYRYDENSLNRKKTKEDWDAARAEMQRHHRRDTLPGPEFC